MIEGRIIICLASSWDYDPTSKHQIMKILARHNDVVWVNYHGTRRPTLSRADFHTSCSVLRRVLGGITQVTPTMTQITPMVIPGATGPILGRLHQRMLIAQIRRAIRSVPNAGHKPRQVWSFAPDVPYLAGKFEEECFLYYCVDEHSQFEGVDEQAIVRAENELIDRADIVVTTSEALLQSKRARRPDVALVRHGVDFNHFSAAWREPLKCPQDLAAIPGPIFGFFGLIHFWIDCALIARVARLRPEYSFVLIGECKRDVSALERLPNVFLLGRRSIDVLPQYCAGFDAGLMPFVDSPLTQTVNPIKMQEYLAAGLPVISTSLPEAEPFLGPITIADTSQRFAEACDRVLAADHPGRRREISRIVENESWLPKVEHLSEMITARIRSSAQTASMPASQVLPVAQPARISARSSQ